MLDEVLVELRAICSAVTDGDAGSDMETPIATGADDSADRAAPETTREDR
ncbi:hypothetical protein ABNG03_18720 [Halorubrum sp. RMP-47]|uniref:Uncharacterized protein n=1 Tax=Halorubrum miltondacostae TaxID=3076378 RepID=A0ABD5M8F2_9EURY